MSVRIYALAKQLRIESKLLVDLCKQLKLDGKGSALASLTDEEVVLIKAELQKENLSSKTAREAVENAGAVQTPVERPSVFIQTGKVPVLKPQKPTRPVVSADNIPPVSATEACDSPSEVTGESISDRSSSSNISSAESVGTTSFVPDVATAQPGSETIPVIDTSASFKETIEDKSSDKIAINAIPTPAAPSAAVPNSVAGANVGNVGASDASASVARDNQSAGNDETKSEYFTDKATGNVGNIIGNILTDNKQNVDQSVNTKSGDDLQNRSIQETNVPGTDKTGSDNLSDRSEDKATSDSPTVNILKEEKFFIDKQRVPSLLPERKNLSTSDVKNGESVSGDLSETRSSGSGSENAPSENAGSSALSSETKESVAKEQTVLNSAEQKVSGESNKAESSSEISSQVTETAKSILSPSEALNADNASQVKEQKVIPASDQAKNQKSVAESGFSSEKSAEVKPTSTLETAQTDKAPLSAPQQGNIASASDQKTVPSPSIKTGTSGVTLSGSPSATGTRSGSSRDRDRGPKGTSGSGQGSNTKSGPSSERRGGGSAGDSGSRNSSRSFSPSQSGKGSRQDSQNNNRGGGNSPLSHIRKTAPSNDTSPKGGQETGGISTLKSMEDAAAKLPLDNFRNKPLSSVSSNNRIKDLNHLSSSKKQKTGTENDKQRHSDTNNRSDNRGSVSVRLVPLPNAPQPKAPKQTREPAPQKPETRFTSIEELKAAAAMEKSGVSPLAGHMQNRNKNKQAKPRKEGKEGIVPQEKVEKTLPEKEDVLFDKTSKKRTDGHFADDDFGNAKATKKNKLKSDQDRSRRRGGGSSLKFMDDDSIDDRPIAKKSLQAKNKAVLSTVPRKGDCVIEMPCTIKQFAETTGVSVASIIKKLMEFGMLATINQPLELDTIELLIEAFELKAIIKKEKSLEELFVDSAFDQIDPPESLKLRPPVVTFLGHVDHGKTSLLDRIMHMNVVAGEKGGITQHIRTYRISTKNGDVTFVDTPGHEAFTEMRARGANCTDIAVLVVAADDGVMPQTEEAISHIKAANVPIVVALNKMDLPGVTREKAIQELASNDLMPSEWGGDVEIVETSATTGMGIEKLMDTLLMIAELRELKANPNRPAMGVSLESSMEPGQGVVCKILVQKGTLHPGDIVLCGTAYGKVKAMTDPLNTQKHLKAAGPSTPVTLLGLNTAPSAGSKFVVLEDISIARQIAEQREKIVHDRELSGGEEHVTLESLFERINNAKTQQTLNVIIRADVRGSIEAIRKELSKLEHPEVKVKILQASVGGITEADVHLADASDAIIVGFNVVPDENARSLAEKKKIQVRRYDIIYKLTEDIRAALEGMLKPIEQVKEMGAAVVQQTFVISRIGTIAGCRVIRGIIDRDCHCRIIRDRRIIGDYAIDTLRREKDDAKEVRDGYECGIKLKNFNDIKQGDTLEAYKIEKIAQTF